MKVIILNSKKHGESRTLSMGLWTRTLLSLCLLGAPMGVGAYMGYMAAFQGEALDQNALQVLQAQVEQEQADIRETKKRTQQQVHALTLRMAELQARLVRLDALGERVTGVAKLDKGEFDFNESPAIGGPDVGDSGVDFTPPDFVQAIDTLASRIDDRAQQLNILETLLANRKIQGDSFLAGRPIKKGWMSSRFGRRTDPFNGRIAMHEGVDFAGKEGSPIIAVASGVVTQAADRSGYGTLVEVNHGGGYVTRYAHNKANLVAVGDIVKKGQVIAEMGSSGRSTGPHVHFEVYKHGRPVDPATYIHRASR